MKYEDFLPTLVEKCPELADALAQHRVDYDGDYVAHNFFPEAVIPMVMSELDSGTPTTANSFLQRLLAFLEESLANEEDDLVGEAIVLSFLAGIGSPGDNADLHGLMGPNLRRWWDINGGQG